MRILDKQNFIRFSSCIFLRPESVDLETGLDAKKMRLAPEKVYLIIQKILLLVK